jgi:hypothetical protein
MVKRKLSRPAKRERVAVWRAFAVDQGFPRDVVSASTKAQLIAALTDEAPAPDPAATEANPHLDGGECEAETYRDLVTDGLHATPLGRAALKLARHVDEATSGGEAAVSARELRMLLATVYSTGKRLSPPAPSGSGSDDGVVVGADRLNAAREAAAGVRKGKKSAG